LVKRLYVASIYSIQTTEEIYINISFAHHLSLRYFGGGEKWLISTVKELAKKGHNIEIYSLPFLMGSKPKINKDQLHETLQDIPYTESYHHNIKSEVVYVTFHSLTFLNFRTSKPRIAGLHSHTYWYNPHPHYGFLPNLANITNRFTSYFDLRRYNAVHTVTNVYPINHPCVYYIPNYVDSSFYTPNGEKESLFTVAYASRKVWQKGWDIFQQIQKKSNFNFLISGSIPEQEMPQFFSKAHVTVVPSRVDTFGLTIVESMMCETPVITTPLETHRALNLPLFLAETPRDYIKTIKFISDQLLNQNLYKLVCDLSRQSALQYDKKLIITKLENMFKEVAENN